MAEQLAMLQHLTLSHTMRRHHWHCWLITQICVKAMQLSYHHNTISSGLPQYYLKYYLTQDLSGQTRSVTHALLTVCHMSCVSESANVSVFNEHVADTLNMETCPCYDRFARLF